MITICRKTFPALRASVMRDFFEILQRENLYSEANHNRAEQTYKLFGNTFEFVSIDQPQKIRGRKRTVVFLNEANELALEDFRQISFRTTWKIFMDYNPSDEFHWIYDHVLTRDDVDFFQTTYKDNPHLNEETIAEIERLKETDENYWRIYGLGERGVNTAAIFPSWDICQEIPENASLVAYGLDWGFTADPTVVVAVYRHDINLYIQEHLYRTGMTNEDIGVELERLNVGKLEIVADSAEPKSIEELYRKGFNIKPAKKGPDSVRMGIDIMKRHKIHIHAKSMNAQKEFRNYRWQEDKNAVLLNKPVDLYDHTVDAVRYVCLNKLLVKYSGKYYIS